MHRVATSLLGCIRPEFISRAILCLVVTFSALQGTAFAQAGVSWTEATADAGWGGRNEQTTIVYNGKMWVLGGFGNSGGGAGNDVWNSADGKTWTRVTAAAAWPARTFHTSLVYNNKMWVIGGENPSDLTRYRDVWSSTDGITWILSTDTPGWVARGYHMSVVFQGKMWVIGGLITTGTIADAWYSTDGSTWVLATDTLPFGFRSRGAMMVYGGKIWMMGGNGNTAVGQNDVWNTPDGVAWTRVTAAAAWPARNFHTGLVYNNKMWIMGGQRPNSSLLNDVWYSSDGLDWTQATAVADWSARYVMSSTVFNNKMWVIAGFSASPGTNPGTEVWYSGVASLRGLTLDAVTGGHIECATVHLTGNSLDRVAFADATGAYRIDDIPNGAYTLEVYAPGYAKSVRSVDVPTPALLYQNLPLSATSAAGSIHGQVTDTATGFPLPGVKVAVTGLPGTAPATLTCADGRYELDNVVTAKTTNVNVQFTAPNYTTQNASVPVTSGASSEKNVSMAKSAVFPGALAGTVRVANSVTAISGAQVTISGGAGMTTTTDNFGSFQFPALPEDHYTIQASASGYASDAQTADVVGSSTTSVDFSLPTVAAVKIKGDVNSDQVVNAVDVQLVINQALSIQTEYDCDINKDAAVDAVDIQLTINAALGVGK